MKVIIEKTAEIVAQIASRECLSVIRKKPNAVLGLATGSTPVKLYEKLVAAHQQNEVSFADITTFNLDEYIGLPAEHEQSYRFFMQKHLFDLIDIPIEQTHLPDGMIDPDKASQQYENAIENAGGIDFQILGIGRNGHIGFNEPFSSLGSRTRIKTLTKATIADNQRFFDESEFQPHLAITMGIGTISQSREILLLATGESKADAIQCMIEGPVAASCPASALQFHPNVTVIIDEAAASRLKHQQYYQWVQDEAERIEESED